MNNRPRYLQEVKKRTNVTLVVFALLAPLGSTCKQSSHEEPNDVESSQQTTLSMSKDDNDEILDKNISLAERMRAIDSSNFTAMEKATERRKLLEEVAKKQGTSVPKAIVENITELLPNPSDVKRLNIVSGICHWNREEMIELIQILPTGKLRTNAVSFYGSEFVDKKDIEAIETAYEGTTAGLDRTLLAGFGAQAAFLGPDASDSLRWIEAMEYPEEKHKAIVEVGNLFKQGLGSIDDRQGFLKAIQKIAQDSGIIEVIGEKGAPLEFKSEVQP